MEEQINEQLNEATEPVVNVDYNAELNNEDGIKQIYAGFAPTEKVSLEWYDRTEKEGKSFPFYMLPETVHDIVINWHAKLGFQPLYTVAAMLAAASVSLGNRVKVQIGPKWKMSPTLWIMTVGNPGTGKSSPTDAVFEQVYEYDKQLREMFADEVKEWVANKRKAPAPKLKQVVLSDFTPESLWKEHGNNPTGIAVLVDEIKGLFDSVERYNPGQLISQLLSTYTGKSIKVTRKGEELPTLIEDSCVGIYGTIQPSLLFKAMKRSLIESGFFDRWLIMWPDYTKCPTWSVDMFCADKDPGVKLSIKSWNDIVYNLLSIGHKNDQCLTVPLSAEAFELLRERNNSIPDSVYDPDADCALEQREYKLGITIGKLALVLEMLEAAVNGDMNVSEVSKQSMESALAIYDWFEKRTTELMKLRYSAKKKAESKDSKLDDLHNLIDRVPLQFKRCDVIELAQRDLRISRASADRLLSFGVEQGLITKLEANKRAGLYEKTNKYIDKMLERSEVSI